MTDNKIYDREDMGNFISTLGAWGKKVSKFAVGGSIIGFFYQMIVLINLKGNLLYLNYFSRTQVISDTMVISSFLVFVYCGFFLGIKFYEKYLYKHSTWKGYIRILCCIIISLGLSLSLLYTVQYFFPNPLLMFIIGFLTLGVSSSFMAVFTIHFNEKRYERYRALLNKFHIGFLSDFGFWLKVHMLFIMVIFINTYHGLIYTDLKVEISNQIHQVRYMNDMYIITENAVFDRDGNRFYSTKILN